MNKVPSTRQYFFLHPPEGQIEVYLDCCEYTNGGTAVQVVTAEEEPYGTVSLWLPESRYLPKGQFYVKGWDENEGMVKELIKLGILREVEGANPLDCQLGMLFPFELGEIPKPETAPAPAKIQILVIGPDGIATDREPFDTVTGAARGLAKFCLRYVQQGYYSDANGRRIPVGKLPDHCHVEVVEE